MTTSPDVQGDKRFLSVEGRLKQCRRMEVEKFPNNYQVRVHDFTYAGDRYLQLQNRRRRLSRNWIKACSHLESDPPPRCEIDLRKFEYEDVTSIDHLVILTILWLHKI